MMAENQTEKELVLFESGTDQETEQMRSRALLKMGGAGVLVVAALLALVLWRASRPQDVATLDNALRAGAAEFDAYKDKVEIEVGEKNVYDNMVGMFQIDVRAKIHNRSDRPITGLEVVGKMFDLNDNVIAQRISLPIPRLRKEPLKPGEFIPISLKVDAPAKITEADVKDVTIELRGLRFQ